MKKKIHGLTSYKYIFFLKTKDLNLLMKNILLYILFVFTLISHKSWSQEFDIKGVVQNNANDKLLNNVHVINLNSIKGMVTNEKGEFTISAKMSDTLYFTYLGFEPQKEVVTNDWIKYGNITIQLTEVGIALEEVLVSGNNLTGFLEIDVKNIPIYETQNRYAIAGLNTVYESGTTPNTKTGRAVKAILNPISSIYNLFDKKKTQLKKLRKIKEDDEIRNLLQDKFGRETLTALLQIEKVDIDEILRNCNYSKEFIKKANDLQILDALNECYDEYRVLQR